MLWRYVKKHFFVKIFFFKKKGTDYNFVNYISKIGDVNLHTFTHSTSISTQLSTWMTEESTLIRDYPMLAQVPDCIITGSRAPYLQPNDDYYTTLQSLGITFDSSMTFSNIAIKKSYWPFTLDFGVPDQTMCNYFGSCPTKAFPGLWEVPITEFDYYNKGNCMDPVYDDYNSYLQLLKDNFMDTYTTNKAPRGFYWHWRYFSTDNNFGILNPSNPINATRVQLFVDFYTWLTTTFPDIIFATERQVIEWMKNPVDYQTTKNLPMFKSCPNLNLNPGNTCTNGFTNCYFPGQVSIGVCGTQCPTAYPDVGVTLSFPAGYTNYLGQCISFDGTETSQHNVTLPPGNTNQVTWKGTLTAQWVSGSGKATNTGVNGWYCAKFNLLNPGPLTAKGFIISFESCPNLAYLTSITGYPDIFNSSSSFRVRATGLNLKKGRSANGVVSWCQNVNFNGQNLFKFPNHINFGVDLYSDAPNCDLPDCAFFCGNGQCDAGETTSNCPIDCKSVSCPARRFLNRF